MIVIIGAVLWLTIGAVLGLAVSSKSFAEGWASVGEKEPETPAEDGFKPVATAAAEAEPITEIDKEKTLASSLTALAAGLAVMLGLTGENLLGLLVSTAVVFIASLTVLMVWSLRDLKEEGSDGDDDHRGAGD